MDSVQGIVTKGCGQVLNLEISEFNDSFFCTEQLSSHFCLRNKNTSSNEHSFSIVFLNRITDSFSGALVFSLRICFRFHLNKKPLIISILWAIYLDYHFVTEYYSVT